jgi:hypothetical protein
MERHGDAVYILSNLDFIEDAVEEAYHVSGPGRLDLCAHSGGEGVDLNT